MQIKEWCRVEFVLTAYFLLLSLILIAFWVYELFLSGHLLKERCMKKKWQACPYCGTLIVNERAKSLLRCPTCNFYLDP